jgi:RNA polymerase sigma factor (sigma-70 family)
LGADSPRSTRQVAEDVLVDPGTRARLCAYARARFGIEEPDAQDLLQETALELLHHESYVRKPDGYVFAVFRSRCVGFVRERALRRHAGEPAPDGDPAAPLRDPDRLVALREALAQLSLRCKQLLCAVYVEGRTLTEAAGWFAIAKGSVTRSVSRCIDRLRRTLS